MSEYVRVKTQFKNRGCLLAALKDCGCSEIEEGTSISLRGYQSGRTAQLVIRRQSIGTTADIGFTLGKDDSYSLIVDSDDRSKVNAKLRLLNARYSQQMVSHLAKINNYSVVSQSKAEGKTKIILRRWQ